MIHTFIDTNVFLSLYAYTDDNIEELKKIIELIKGKQLKIYVNPIVNQEFNRNRDQKILESLGNFEKFSTSLSIPRFMEHHQESNEIRVLLKQLSDKRAALVAKAKKEIVEHQLAADQLFLELRTAAGLTSVSPDVDKAARLRLERGNPPGKDGSLGDRINWEFLLEKVPTGEDIHVVSRDKDFASPWGKDIPNSFLSGEWRALKQGTMYLYPGLKPFVKAHFPDISLASDVGKNIAINALINSASWQTTHNAIAQLTPFSADITGDEAKKLFDALLNNDEINAIIEDTDVKDFFLNLLNNHWKVLESDQYSKVSDLIEDHIPF